MVLCISMYTVCIKYIFGKQERSLGCFWKLRPEQQKEKLGSGALTLHTNIDIFQSFGAVFKEFFFTLLKHRGVSRECRGPKEEAHRGPQYTLNTLHVHLYTFNLEGQIFEYYH